MWVEYTGFYVFNIQIRPIKVFRAKFCFGSKKPKESKELKLSNRFSNKRFVFLKN